MPAQYEPRLEFAFTVKISLDRAYWVRPPDIGCVRAGIYLKDGTVIYLQNRGFRWGPQAVMDAMARNEPVDHGSYYFRTSPKFEAPEGKHDWVNRHIFIGVGEKVPKGNQIHYYKLV